MIIYRYNSKAPQLKAKKPRRRQAPPSNQTLLSLFLLLLLVSGVAIGYQMYSQRAAVVVVDDGLPADMELIAPKSVFLNAEDQRAGLRVGLSFVAPKEWRTQKVNADSAKLSPNDYMMAAFVLTAGPAGQPSLDPTATLRLENISAWLQQGNTTAKQAYIDWLISLRKTREVSASAAAPYSALLNDKSATRKQLQYIHSADGKLSGVAFVTNTSKDGTQQVLMTRMAGVINGQTVYSDAQFTLDPPSDGLIARAVAVVQSIAIDTTGRVKNAAAVDR